MCGQRIQLKMKSTEINLEENESERTEEYRYEAKQDWYRKGDSNSK